MISPDTLKKNFISSFSEKVLRAALTFVSLAIVGRYLGPEQYGFLSYLLAIVTYFQLFGAFGLDQRLMRVLVDRKDEEKQLFWQSAFFKTIMSAISYVLYILFLFWGNEFNLLSGLFGLAIFSSILDNNRIFLETQNKHSAVARFEMIYQILSALTKIVMSNLDAGRDLIFSLFVLDFFISKFMLYFPLKKSIFPMPKYHFGFKEFTYLFKTGGFHCLSAIFIIVYMKIDQVMVGKMMGMNMLGNYSAAVRISDAWYFLPVTVGTVFYPMALTQLSDKNNKFLQIIFDLTWWISVGVIGFALIFSDEIFSLMFGKKFVIEKMVLTLLFCSGFFISMSVSTAAWLNVKSYNRVLFIRSVSGALSNIGLNLILIPRYGLIGVAWATLISYIITISITFIATDSKECFDYVWRSFNIVKAFDRSFEVLMKKNRV